MTPVSTFFSTLAERATQAMATNHPEIAAPSRTVSDTSQDFQATTWQAVAVHPLQVLETEYQALVRALAGKAKGDDERREAEAEALQRFFTLGSGAPRLLGLPKGGVADDLARTPLIDEEVAALRAQVRVIGAMINDKAETAESIRTKMEQLIERALKVLQGMAPVWRKDWIAPALHPIFDAMNLAQGQTPSMVATQWRVEHTNYSRAEDLRELLVGLSKTLVEPLADPAAATASARCLYNIRNFYLLRLMHRFIGGSGEGEMSLALKQEASGFVTGAMHSASWNWMTTWHEAAVSRLDQALVSLDGKLRTAFGRNDPILKFFLKGGRALFTALGTPDQGANDWDTGVLIDPSLPADQWYQAFAAVNDQLILSLDRLRFEYTQLLYQNAASLQGGLGAEMLDARQEVEELAEFTRLGAAADEMLRRAPPGPPAPVAALDALSRAELLAHGSGGPRPVTINGELIDIGVATRSSVELREHWTHMTVVRLPGVSGARLPVPDLGFFVDDFSTILRDEIAGGGEPDRKLAKRLQRLERLLASTDGNFVQAISQRLSTLQTFVPATTKVLGDELTANTPPARLAAWALHALVHDLKSDPSMIEALDAHMAEQHARLFDETNVDVKRLWTAIEGAFASAADKGASTRRLLAILNGAHVLGGRVIAALRERERALGVSSLWSERPAGEWKNIRDLIETWIRLTDATASNGIGPLVATGALAVRLQMAHAGLKLEAAVETWPAAVMEIDLCLSKMNLAQAEFYLKSLPLIGSPFDGRVEGVGAEARLIVTAKSGSISLSSEIACPRPVVFIIRPVDAGSHVAERSDLVDGWRVDSVRALAAGALTAAAAKMDYDLRELGRGTFRLLSEEVLGRQI